ncbi:MAG: glycosyltransferase [Phycisphaera sp.]|nr:glycosyltransferase [Phycisphaera sp.]
MITAKLLIVIVNYRTADLVVDCLRSLQGELDQLPGARVAVVDNHSADGSAEKLESEIALNGWARRVTLIPLETNGGFAAGNNVAIRAAFDSSRPPDYVLLLNPDTLVEPNAILELIEFASDHTGVGIFGCRQELGNGEPLISSFRFIGALGEFESYARLGLVSRVLSRWVVAPTPRDEPHQVDWVSGASMLVRREVFDAVGELDEGYFLYFDEVDFCLRARRAGWPCWYVPSCTIVHLVGRASGVVIADPCPARRPAYWFESRRRYYLKNFGRFRAACADAAVVFGHGIWSLRRLVQRLPHRDPPHFLGDLLRHSFARRRIDP